MLPGMIITIISILVLTASSEFQDISTCTAPDGNNYQANTTFTTSDCLMHCVCTPNGHIGCVPLCPSVRWKCPIGYKRTEVTQHAGVKDSGCFCKKVTCKALTNNVGKTSYCFEGDKYYKPGEEFIENCTKLCRCYKKGLTRCVPLCPHEKPCPLGTKEIEVPVPVEYNRGSCKCKRRFCKPLQIEDQCHINGHFYKPGDDIISPDCSSYCKCHPGGSVFCVSLCPPEGINCEHNEDTIKLLRKIPNSNCSCPTWRCVKRQEEARVFRGQEVVKHTCASESGNLYRVGQVFMDRNCSLKCHCQEGGKVTCQPLCARNAHIQECDPSENRKVVNFPVLLPHADSQSNCSCPIEICEPAEDKCIVGEYTYKPGDDFVSPDCSGYCKCYSGGSVLCVSLCPPEKISCHQNEYKIQSSRKISNSTCTCPTWKCLKKRQEVITRNMCVSKSGSVYQIGQVFTDQNCTLQCHCKDGGKIKCRSLCSNKHTQPCAPFENQKVKLTKVQLPDGEGKSCSCPITVCEPREVVREDYIVKCTVGEYTYNPGDEFVSSDCSGYCKCHPGGGVLCVSLCPPEGITCQHNEDTIQSSRKIPNSNCTCPTWKCLKKKQEAITKVMSTCVSRSGNVYQVGQVFSDQNCTLQCHCKDGGKITCRSLCPDNGHTPDCAPFENQKILNLPVPLPDDDGKSCSCSTKICEPREVVRKVFHSN